MGVLNVGRRDLHAEVALAILTGAEVAQQRGQGVDLATLVTEMDPVGEAPPLAAPFRCRVLELCFQYRRQQTTVAKGLPCSAFFAWLDSMNVRIATSVDSHQVGAPTTTRSYSRSVTASRNLYLDGPSRSSAGIIPNISRYGFLKGNDSNRFS